MAGVVELEVGSLLLSLPSPRFLLNQQYLHKSILVVVEHTPNLTVAVVLNRPTSTFVQIEVDDPVGDGEIARRVCFGGEASVHGKEVW